MWNRDDDMGNLTLNEVKDDGSLWTAGNNSQGQLELPSNTSFILPTVVSDLLIPKF